MEYELIGQTINIANSVDKQLIEHAIQKIRTVFNNTAQRYASLHIGCGAIRWTWLLTLLFLRKEQIECEEELTEFSKEKRHDIRIRICEAELRVRVTEQAEYILRKAAKDVTARIKDMENSGVNPDISVRRLAFEIVSKLHSNMIM